MKRFYSLVDVVERDGSYIILLDQKPVYTPQKKQLLISNKSLAAVAADEWRAQHEKIVPHAMPMTQILMTAQDITHHNRINILAEIVHYIDSDLLCYRAEKNTIHGRKQDDVWGHVIDLLAAHFNLPILVTTDIQMLHQSAALHERIKNIVTGLDDILLTVVHILVQETGSIFLTLSFLHHLIATEQVEDALMLDEAIKAKIYHEDVYGAAPDQEKKRHSLGLFLTAATIVRDVLTAPK